MAKLVLKRIAAFILVLFIVSVGAFYLVHLSPGNPAISILGPNATAQNVANIDAQLGLKDPIWQQYFVWLGHALQGNLGQSYLTHQTVANIIATGLPIDIELILISQIMAFAVAIPLALLAARRPNKPLDRVSTTATFALLAAPPFVIAPLLVYFFCIHWHVFPGPASYTVGASFWSNFQALILPSIVLAVGSIVVYYRILRNDLIATLQEDFVTMARSKGLNDRRVLLRHALRPSSLSLVAATGINIGALVGGVFVVEFLFQIPGLGYEIVYAIEQQDYLVVQGLVLVVAAIILAINFAVDLSYSVIDPRVAHD